MEIVPGVQHKGLQPRVGLAENPQHVTGTAEPGGNAHHQGFLIAVLPGLIQNPLDGLPVGQGGFGDLPGEAVVDLLGGNIHLVVIGPLGIDDFQGDDPHIIPPPQGLRHVAARVH